MHVSTKSCCKHVKNFKNFLALKVFLPLKSYSNHIIKKQKFKLDSFYASKLLVQTFIPSCSSQSYCGLLGTPIKDDIFTQSIKYLKIWQITNYILYLPCHWWLLDRGLGWPDPTSAFCGQCVLAGPASGHRVQPSQLKYGASLSCGVQPTTLSGPWHITTTIGILSHIRQTF